MHDEHCANRQLHKTSGETEARTPVARSRDETREALALIKILALGTAQVEAGQVKPVGEVIARLRAKPVPED